MFKITQKQISTIYSIVSKNNQNFDINRYLTHSKYNIFETENYLAIYLNNIKRIAKIEYYDDKLTYVEKLNILSNVFGYKNFQIMNGLYIKKCNNIKTKLPFYKEPVKKSDFNIHKIKHIKNIPSDAFYCCLDNRLYQDVLLYSQITGDYDYRLYVVHNKKLNNYLDSFFNK